MGDNTLTKGPKLDRASFPLVKAFTELAGRRLKELDSENRTFKEVWDFLQLSEEIKLTIEAEKPCFFTVENVIPDYVYERRTVPLNLHDVIEVMSSYDIPMIPGNWETVKPEDWDDTVQGEYEPLKLDLRDVAKWEAHSKFVASCMIKRIIYTFGIEPEPRLPEDWLARIERPDVADSISKGILIVGHMISFIRRVEGADHLVVVEVLPVSMNLETGVTWCGIAQELTIDDRELNITLSDIGDDDGQGDDFEDR